MKTEKSIFEVNDQEFRKQIVDAINGLIKRADRHSRLITSLDENCLKLQREVDELDSDLDDVRTELDSLKN